MGYDGGVRTKEAPSVKRKVRPSRLKRAAKMAPKRRLILMMSEGLIQMNRKTSQADGSLRCPTKRPTGWTPRREHVHVRLRQTLQYVGGGRSSEKWPRRIELQRGGGPPLKPAARSFVSQPLPLNDYFCGGEVEGLGNRRA